MIDIPPRPGHEPQIAAANARHKTLRMVKSDRMAGSIPVWINGNGESQRNTIENTLSAAAQGRPAPNLAPGKTLAYRDPAGQASANTREEKEFGFADLLDMVNPLQHIPVLNTVYREITGDTIRPISQIIGGAVFGGPLGAAGGIVNAIVQEETGSDLTGAAMALMLNGHLPRAAKIHGSPEARLSAAAAPPETPSTNDIPGGLLAFTDLKHAQTQAPPTTRFANGETVTWDAPRRPVA
ncbi:MAG: hypothetical protein IT559_05960 [Alphaproteobacteria bacterium]|nr:hypothetical protein [Alphaproteobacteria bacterium]